MQNDLYGNRQMGITEEEKNLGVLIHVLSLFIGIFSPLIFYFVKKDSEYVRKQTYSAFNYHINYYIYTFVAGILCFVLIGLILLPIIAIAYIVFIIIAIVKATKGEIYKVPFTFEFIK